MTDIMDLEALSNRNLVYSFQEQLTELAKGAEALNILTKSQRDTLRRHGILTTTSTGQGRALELTEIGQKYLREAKRQGDVANT